MLVSEISTQTPQTNTLSIEHLLNKLEKGDYLLPEFQREYVWNLEQTRNLFLSIISGRVIGGVLIWETDININSTHLVEVPPHALRVTKFSYILDGQQRMTSIYAAAKGLVHKSKDFKCLQINLEAEDLSELLFISKQNKPDIRHVPFYILFQDESLWEAYDLKTSEFKLLIKLKYNILNYNVVMFKLMTDDLEEAIRQFNTLNSGGRNMSKEDIVLSKIYSTDFQLKNNISDLIAKTNGFGLTTTIILDSLSFTINHSFDARTLLNLNIEDVKKHWSEYEKSILKVCDYFVSLDLLQFKEIMYKSIFLVIHRIFFQNNLTTVTAVQNKNIIKYILSSVFAERYGSGMTTKAVEDFNTLNSSFDMESSTNFSVNLTLEELINKGKGNKNLNSTFHKTILWTMKRNKPLSLMNNNTIKLDRNSFSKRYDKNLHHIFPKNYLKDTITKYDVHHIVNIAFVEAEINQYNISDKAPNIYLKELGENNPFIETAYDSLLMDGEIAMQNNYDLFFIDRANRLLNHINSSK